MASPPSSITVHAAPLPAASGRAVASPILELGLLALLVTAAILLRLAGSATLPWSSAELAFSSRTGWNLSLLRALALALGAASPAFAFGILRTPFGPATALAGALLLALSPWHLHASRSGDGASLGLLLLAPPSLAVLRVARDGRRGMAFVLVPALAIAGCVVAAWLVARFGLEGSPVAAGRTGFAGTVATLVADVGLGTVAFAMLALFSTRQNVALLGWLLAIIITVVTIVGRGDGTLGWRFAAPLLVVVAVPALGEWLDAAQGTAQRIGLLALACVPAVPSLGSELIDGGRYDLAQVRPELLARRHGDEPVFAADPRLAERALGVTCRALPEVETSEPAGLAALFPAETPAWFILLVERESSGARAATVASFATSAAIEGRCELVARHVRKRLDFQRYEVRLYRSRPTP